MALPDQLVTAIDAAAKQYNLDPSYLLRIWQFESGGTFPNTAVNSAGYGGLFGLGLGQTYGPYTVSDYNDVQTQANAAAWELNNLIQANGGSVYNAMLQYSGGSMNEAAFVAGGTTPTSYSAGSSSGLTAGGEKPSGTLNSLSGSFSSLLNGIGGLGSGISLTASPSQIATGLSKDFLGLFVTTVQGFFDNGAFWDPLFVIVGLGIMGLGIIGTMTGQKSATGTLRTVAKGAIVVGAT